MADSSALQALATALQTCSLDPPTSPDAARAALSAADLATQALAHLLAEPAQHAVALDSAVSAMVPWVQSFVGRLDRWEAALGLQPVGPEKSALDFPFRGFTFGPPPPPPGARRRAGAIADAERCAARLQAAAVLTLIDAGLACQQARLPPLAAERGARDVPEKPTPLEEAAYQCLKRLEDTGLPYPVRPAAGTDAAQAGQATAAGIRALGTCCSVLLRLLRLVGRREYAQPAAQPPGRSAEGGGAADLDLDSVLDNMGDPWDTVRAKCRPVELTTAMDVLYDASAVLSFWAPRPGKAPGREHQAAWDACLALIQHVWGSDEVAQFLDGDTLSYGTAERYGSKLSRYIALSPVLAYHAMLCDRAPELRSAPPAELASWASAMHRVLSLLTEPFHSRIKGIAGGGCVGGPAAAFDSGGRCELLTRSAAVLRLLPSLAAAAAASAADCSVSSVAAGSGDAASSGQATEGTKAAGRAAVAGAAFGPAEHEVCGTEQLVLEVGQMLVQLVAGGCSSFNADVRETATKGQSWWGSNLPHVNQAHAVLGLELLPALVAPPLAVLSANGPALQAAAQRSLYGHSAAGGSLDSADAHEAAKRKWIEWHVALYRLCELAWSLGEEVEAGPAGSPFGSDGGRTGKHRIVPTLDAAALAAEEAAKAAGAWPPRDPAILAAAAAAAQHLLARWHTIRAALLPLRQAGSDASMNAKVLAHLSRIALRFEQRVPHTCRQLVAAAAAAMKGSSSAQLQAALMPLFDAAGTACKLVLLASRDADHRVLLGVAEAAPANEAPDFCPPCRPYRPIYIMLAACQAATECMQRLMPQPSALPLEQQEYARRRTRALLLQLCAASEAATMAGEPLASQIEAAWANSSDGPTLSTLLGMLLEACGSVHSGIAAKLGGSLHQGLAEVRALAGSEVQQQLALSTLPCANAACTAAGAGGSEAALPGRRCSGCSTARYSSALCQQAAWVGGHKHSCRGLAAEVAAAPPAVPLPYGAEAPRKRERALLCPLCGMGLALAAAAEGTTTEQHVATCLRRRQEQLAAQQAQHGGDVAAAAAALPEVQSLRQSRQEQEERTARLAAEVQHNMQARAASSVAR